MKRFLTGLMAFLLTVVVTSNTQAGFLASALSFDHTLDVLDDDSGAIIGDRDGDSKISVGDVFAGLMRIGEVDGTTLQNTDQLIGVFSFTVASVTQTGGFPGSGNYMTLAPTAAVDALSLANMMGVGFGAVGATDVIAVVSDTGNAVNPVNLGLTDALVALAATYSREATLGIGAGANAHGSTDYLEVFFGGLDTNNDGFIQLTELPAGATAIGSEAGGLTVTSHTMGAGIVFLGVSSQHLPGFGGSSTHDVDLQGTLSSSGGGNYLITDSTVLRVNAVPEPSTMTLFGLGLAGLGFVGYRRRKRQQAA